MLTSITSYLRTRVKKILIYTIGFILFVILVKFIVLKLAPEGYTKQKCMTPLREIRKAENLIQIFTHVADSQNFTWWVDYGTLLGTIREGHIIPFDKDVDAGCLESDVYKLFSLEPLFHQYGIQRYGSTYVWAEDLWKMENGREEEVVAKLEFFTPVMTRSGIATRVDVVPFLKGETFADRIWWVLLRATGVTFPEEEVLFPVSRATLRRYMPIKEIRQKLLKEEEKMVAEDPSRTKDKHNLKFYEADEDDEATLRKWEVSVPVPSNPKKQLQKLYGPTWNVPIKWKVSCYV